MLYLEWWSVDARGEHNYYESVLEYVICYGFLCGEWNCFLFCVPNVVDVHALSIYSVLGGFDACCM